MPRIRHETPWCRRTGSTTLPWLGTVLLVVSRRGRIRTSSSVKVIRSLKLFQEECSYSPESGRGVVCRLSTGKDGVWNLFLREDPETFDRKVKKSIKSLPGKLWEGNFDWERGGVNALFKTRFGSGMSLAGWRGSGNFYTKRMRF